MPAAPRRPPMSDPWFSRLRPVRPEDEALDQLLAEAAETLGFRSAAIVLARETTGEFEYVALHGDEHARELLHTHLARDHVLAQVEAADVLGVVRHLSAEARADLGFVAPGAPRTSARSWHPDDLLVAALKQGADLRGLLVLDDPIDGKAPSDASKARIHDWTRSHCAQVLARDEHRRADEGAGLAESAVTILRLLRAGHPSPVDRAQACLEALRVALDGRLVSRVLPDDELLGAAYAIAREIADNTSAVSVALTRQLLWGMLGAPSPWDAHRADSAAIAHLGQGRDVAEGVTSFLEKRPPAFPDTVSDDYPGHVLPHWPAPPADLTD